MAQHNVVRFRAEDPAEDPNIIRLVPSRQSDIGFSTWAFWLAILAWLIVVVAVYGGWSWL